MKKLDERERDNMKNEGYSFTKTNLKPDSSELSRSKMPIAKGGSEVKIKLYAESAMSLSIV